MTELSWVGKGYKTLRDVAAQEILEIMGESRNALAKKFSQREEILLEAARASLISQSTSRAAFTLEHEKPLPQQNFSSTLGGVLSRLEDLGLGFTVNGQTSGSNQGAAQIKISINHESAPQSNEVSVLEKKFSSSLDTRLTKFGAEAENLQKVAKFEVEIRFSWGGQQEVKSPWQVNLFAIRNPNAKLCEAERFADIVNSLRHSDMTEFRGFFDMIRSANEA
jgi:hypothetical protein